MKVVYFDKQLTALGTQGGHTEPDGKHFGPYGGDYFTSVTMRLPEGTHIVGATYPELKRVEGGVS